jgi:hypothetical protein
MSMACHPPHLVAGLLASFYFLAFYRILLVLRIATLRRINASHQASKP